MKKLIFIILLFMLPVSVFANSLEIQCQNKLTEKFLEEFDDFYLQQCQSYGDKKWYKSDISDCKKHKLAKRKVEVCRLLEKNGLIDWSHQKRISISNFNTNAGIAYKYTIPCWTYGSPTKNEEYIYVIKNNLMTLAKEDSTDFNIDLNNLSAGYGESREYLCKFVK